MVKGYHIQFIEGGRTRLFKVAIANQEDAVRTVIGARAVEGIVVLPLKDGEFERLSMKEGQIIESAHI